jgi:hypothetical protein
VDTEFVAVVGLGEIVVLKQAEHLVECYVEPFVGLEGYCNLATVLYDRVVEDKKSVVVENAFDREVVDELGVAVVDKELVDSNVEGAESDASGENGESGEERDSHSEDHMVGDASSLFHVS